MMSMKIRKLTGRDGVSLLEILICIGILSVGLLSVVSLIPAGHFAVVETTKADRSTACARAAKAQVQLRNMLDPMEWYVWNSTTYSYETLRSGGLNLYGSTVVLDPLGVAIGEGAAEPRFFPFDKNVLWRFTTAGLLDPGGNLPISNAAFHPLRIQLCELACRWSDDVNITVDDTNPDQRPRQSYKWLKGTTDPVKSAPAPYVTGDDENPAADGYTAAVQEFQGDFSWFLTVTPDVSEAFLPVQDMKSFEVATVVCYKRIPIFDTSVDVPEERTAYVAGVTINAATAFTEISGAGASDIPLAMPDSTASIDEYLEVKPGQWIMLVGEKLIMVGGTPTPCRIAKWYRVLSVDSELQETDATNTVKVNTGAGTPDAKIRWVTVTGPEWHTSMLNTKAILVDSVIGVFTETMTVDR